MLDAARPKCNTGPISYSACAVVPACAAFETREICTPDKTQEGCHYLGEGTVSDIHVEGYMYIILKIFGFLS